MFVVSEEIWSTKDQPDNNNNDSSAFVDNPSKIR